MGIFVLKKLYLPKFNHIHTKDSQEVWLFWILNKKFFLYILSAFIKTLFQTQNIVSDFKV